VAGAEVALRPDRGPADGLATTAATDPARPLWRFEFRKPLASPSQPFELVAQRQVGWGELPWGRVAGAALAIGALLGALAAWRAQAQARRRAEELLRLGQLARLNTLGELAAGMAHELNQPLTAVLAATQAARRLLDDDPPELDESRAAMQHAVAQAGRASAVVARLRRLVERPDAGPASQTLVLAEVVREVLDLLEPECRRRAVPPRLQLGAGTSPAVRADPVALQQIVHNLVMNALQALERVPAAERSLLLQIGTDGADAVLGVTDSGPGIPPEALPRVFEPFFTTREGGLGLGLSLSETLALGLGGSLAAASASSPRGATFTLWLPLA
jgi:C4-dicarboxylate-specific signal transduction histidine kinase